jgi:hypothetical protein
VQCLDLGYRHAKNLNRGERYIDMWSMARETRSLRKHVSSTRPAALSLGVSSNGLSAILTHMDELET